MKKMKNSRTSTIVLHNLLIAALAIFWLIPIVWLVCTSFSEYSGMNTSTFFPEKWSAIHYSKLFHPVPTVVHEYVHHCMLYLCDLYDVCIDGGLCYLCYAF